MREKSPLLEFLHEAYEHGDLSGKALQEGESTVALDMVHPQGTLDLDIGDLLVWYCSFEHDSSAM